MRVIDERGLVYDYRYIHHAARQDPKYALPKLKKYPLPDRAHVKSAIKFFNYVSPRYEKTLAYAILKCMDEYGMSFDDITIGDNNRFKKYVPKSDHLAHYGVQGMHWGIRRFQPYPSGYHGDGKFVGKDSRNNNQLKEVEATNNLKRTGIKDVDDILNVINKYNIPPKPTGWDGNYTDTEKESIRIGLKSLPDMYDKHDPNNKYDMDWFVWEDQTIGMYAVADLARQGKTVSEIKEALKESYVASKKTDKLNASSNAYKVFMQEARQESVTLFELGDFYIYSKNGPLGFAYDQYINNCVKEANKNKSVLNNHISNTDKLASRASQMKSSGKTYAEIAKALGIPESSVGYYLSR